MFYDDYSALPDSSYYYTVTSFDNQTATSASGYATAISVLPLAINSHDSEVEFLKIYPNPFSASTTLRITIPPQAGRITNAELKIFDVFGNVVFEKTLNSKYETLNLDLPGGMYFYQVKDNKQFFSSGKLIVQ